MSLDSKKLFFGGFLCLLIIILTEAFASTALWFLESRVGPVRRTSTIYAEQTERISALLDVEHPVREMLDPILGWRYRPGYQKGNDIISFQGLRSERNYAQVPREDVFRIAAFGDSFVYGNEVGTSDVWTSQMEVASPRLEVLNFGVGGYGVDQAYLRYRSEGSHYSPHMVLIGFMPDDLRRLVNVYRRFIDDAEVPLFKPRFLREGQGLKLIPSPIQRSTDYEQLIQDPKAVKRLGRYDQWYEPMVYENPLYDFSVTVRLTIALGMRAYGRYFDPNRLYIGGKFNPKSEAFILQLSLFHHFTDEVRRSGAIPLILLFPERDSIERARSGSTTVYAPLAAKLSEERMPFLDLGEAFRSETIGTIDSLFMQGGHYSRRGNEIVAQWLLAQLRQSEKHLPRTQDLRDAQSDRLH